jgi:tryptophan synthase alpha chain
MIADVFARARAEGRAALILYLVAGDPDLETTAAVIAAIGAAGADLVELGIPYADPLADGPVIAAAAHRALERGTGMKEVFALAAGSTVPLVFFSYVNPIVQYGAERFARDARAAGALGAIVPDVPLEELDAFAPDFAAAGLELPLLVAPTTPPDRAAALAEAAGGFLYVVSRLGVTGARREPDTAWIAGALERLRARVPGKALAVGFGISTPEHVAAVGAIADGVIVGSALVERIAGKAPREAADAAYAYVSSLRAALPRR